MTPAAGAGGAPGTATRIPPPRPTAELEAALSETSARGVRLVPVPPSGVAAPGAPREWREYAPPRCAWDFCGDKPGGAPALACDGAPLPCGEVGWASACFSLSQERLEWRSDGTLLLTLKNVWKDSTHAFTLAPHDLLAWLCAAFSPP